MATDDDTLMRDRVRPGGSSILAMLDANESKAAVKPRLSDPPPPGHEGIADSADPLPKPGDDYRAFARPMRQETGIAFLTDAVPFDAFGYFDLRRIRFLHADKPGGSPLLLLRFIEAEITEVAIEGRNLFGQVDYLRQHRIAWIRELPKGLIITDPAAVVVTKITYRKPGLMD